jgi:hypothetical protein
LKSSITGWLVWAKQSWLDATEVNASNTSFVFMCFLGVMGWLIVQFLVLEQQRSELIQIARPARLMTPAWRPQELGLFAPARLK